MVLKSSKQEYTKNNKTEKIILIIDNDECLGAWSMASAIYNIFSGFISNKTGIKVSKCKKVLKYYLIKYYFTNGGARPGTKDTLRLAKFYKDTGYIDSVIMFTSAKNENEWVSFLKECLEEYAGVEGLYDHVLHKNNSESKLSPDGSTVKCMNMVRKKLKYNKNSKIIIIDDKPQNIIGECIKVAVSEYRHILKEKYISDMIDNIIETLQLNYIPVNGVETVSPNSLKNIIKYSILVDENGLKQDIKDNIEIHMCSLDQLDDTSLIKNCAMTFIDNLSPPIKLSRSLTYNNQPLSFKLKRAISL
jgi:hypothetical protein